MKTICFLLSIFSILSFNVSNGQSLKFTNVMNNGWGTPNSDLSVYAYIVNKSNSVIRIKMRSEVIDTAEGSRNYFCLSLCYTPGVVESPDFEQIEPGDTLKSFKGYYRPYGSLDAASIKYTFFNVNNLTDSIQMIGYFSPSPASIYQIEKTNLNLFPNPADGYLQVGFEFKNQQNNSIVIYNSLGQKVYSEYLITNIGLIKINTQNFKEGIYFCSISESGKFKRTERFMILH